MSLSICPKGHECTKTVPFANSPFPSKIFVISCVLFFVFFYNPYFKLCLCCDDKHRADLIELSSLYDKVGRRNLPSEVNIGQN